MAIRCKYFIPGFLWLMTVVSVMAQDDYLNNTKYWNLRKRLVTDFVKPGLGPGESVPANKYSLSIAWSSYPHSLVKKLEWGDATAQLGWYLAVMATELKLLQQSGDTSSEYYFRLIEEIYFGLEAINRLDDVAEVIWSYAPDDCNTRLDRVEPVLWDSVNGKWLPKPGSNVKPERNGFFIRMDGTEQLLKYFTKASSINTSIVRPWIDDDTLQLKRNSTNAGSFGFFVGDPNAKGFSYKSVGYYPYSESSQDQVFHLLMGLMLVHDLVGEEIEFSGNSLKSMSREIALRILDHYDGMVIHNPLKPKRALCNAGGNSFAFWMSVKKIKRYFEKGKKNKVKDQIYLWGKINCETSYQVNRSLFAIVSALANSTPQQDLCRYTTRDGFSWGFYTLLRSVLYNIPVRAKGCFYGIEQIKYELGLCPFRGPHLDAFAYGDTEDYRVRTENEHRSFKEYTKQEVIDNKVPYWHYTNRFYQTCSPNTVDQKYFVVNQGEFNGLDYLLLYNLANLYFGIDAMGGNYLYGRKSYFD